MRDLSKSPSGPSALLLERRIAPRRNTYIEARITFGKTSLNCIIRNLSDTGAKLEVAKVAGIPDVFLLHAPGHRPQTCRVVWRALNTGTVRPGEWTQDRLDAVATQTLAGLPAYGR